MTRTGKSNPVAVAALALAAFVIWKVAFKEPTPARQSSDNPAVQRAIDSAAAEHARLTSLPVTEAQIAAAFPSFAFERRRLADGRDDFSAHRRVTIIEAIGTNGLITTFTIVSGIAKDEPQTAADALENSLRAIALVSSSPKACSQAYMDLIKKADKWEEIASICEGHRIAVRLGSFSTMTITMAPQ